MKNCLVNAIEEIRRAKVTALWALKTMGSTSGSTATNSSISTVDLLKYLTSQALRFGPPPTERTLSLSCARFQSARTEKEWVDLLAASLSGLKQVFIVVDIELLSPDLALQADSTFTLPESFGELFAQLNQRCPDLVVKVILASYGSPLLCALSEAGRKDLLLAGKAKGKPQRAAPSRGAARSLRGSRLGLGRGR